MSERWWLPHPLMTPFLAIVWLLLANDFSAGHLVLGLILGWLMPLFTARFWPMRPSLRRPWKIVEYVLLVLYDIVVANVIVARLILFHRNDAMRSQYVVVPLDVTSPEAITLLAGTITMTPGTVSADIAADGRSLLVHCLDLQDADAQVAEIKSRYEARLLEIFS